MSLGQTYCADKHLKDYGHSTKEKKSDPIFTILK